MRFSGEEPRARRLSWLVAITAALCSGILVYSQLATLDWDEGFHLLAAFLINAGKRPYIDFCFPQPPLHAFWNAFWLRVSGDSWRAPQLAAAILTCGAIVLTAELVYRRTASQIQAALAVLFTGMNPVVVEFGTKAQAYGAGLFLTTAAFRIALAGSGIWPGFAAGVLAGTAADCTLLTAPACVVLLGWEVWRRRFRAAAAFVGGAAIGLLPLIVAFVRAPGLTWFNLVKYHVFFRSENWGGATEQDFGVLASWVDSGSALLLGLFAALSLASPAMNAEERRFRGLCSALAIGLGLEAATAHPTFGQYFIFVVPFLAILAADGVCTVARRLAVRPVGMAAGVLGVLALSLGNALVDAAEENNNWDNIATIARKVKEVTPPDCLILADPPVYFALRMIPPMGSNFPASHRMDVSVAEGARLHVVPQAELERQVKAGEFATAETCRKDADEVQALELPKYYSQSASISDCQIYWGFRDSAQPAREHR